MTFSTRWQLTEKMYKDFWRRWSTDYLQTLQTRSKWHFPTKNLEVGDVVIVREDNIPPAKWILGRVLETHPGADGRVRVVTLKTKTSNMKRPITKLSRLPLDPSSYTTASSDVDTTKPAINTQRKRRNNNGKKHFNNLFCTLLLIFSMCVGPTTQQMINITRLSSSRVVYFDKVSDVQIIQDKWKMVVYYNMTTYWRSLDNIQNYVNHLNTLCKKEAAYLTISSQFQHELNEIQHYNDILRSEHGPSRRKRGLVNGIGYLANSLFGTLDERFANQYVKDINIIQSNENHLLNLYKNHTSIIESEYNLLKRNEEVMNTQFRIIDNHLAETEKRIQISHDNAMYITATALAVNLIISNIRQIQQQLLDLVTDVKDGRVDTHLIKPNQFEDQLNIISGHLPSELSLPCVNTRHCTRSLYKLARVHVRLTSAYIIFEVKLPLINNEQYELNHIIPIPQITGHTEKTIVLTSEYLAVNLKGDMIIPLENRDVSSCLNLQENKMLCAINQPIYNIKVADTLCEAQILNNGDSSTCRTRVLDCNDRWVRLHNRGAWLFSCCEDCTMRIFCPAGVTSQHLHGTGIMLLGLGCMLKGESFIIHARNDYHSELKLTGSEERMYMRESSLNHILTDFNHTFGPEDHKDALQELKNNIDKVKEQQQTLSVQSLTHDTHNYVLYTLVGFIIVAFIAWGTFRLKRRCQGCSVNLRDKPDPNNVEQPTQGHSSEHGVSDIDSVDAVIATAARKLNRGSSP
ncbi:unnamed protein product [Parnassius apollo]|uniref:(apollo) hypothetical protein n=1 Tax=Parnassius apollo TaxID=110799 RepID=A0A8S3X619_PARAO|nr:unnamed protein product [Parnassius apollo]